MSAWIFGMTFFCLISGGIVLFFRQTTPKPKGLSRETEKFIEGLKWEQEQQNEL